MRQHLPWKSFVLPSVLALLGAVGAGCGGCDDPEASCDAEGNCVVCDAYGCYPADPSPTAGAGGSGGAGQGGTGGVGQGGSTTGEGGGTTGAGGTGSGGAPPECDPLLTTCGCETADDCGDGTQCVNGLCIDGCQFTYECGADEVCVNGGCVAACDAPEDCGPGYTCDGELGVCVVDPANPECSDELPCADGADCVGGLCQLPCEANADCAEGQICDATSGHCIDDPAPTEACADDVDCTGVGQVCGDDGYCHYPCSTVEECKLIDARFDHCDAGFCKTDEEVNPECSIEDPCPEGQDCVSNVCL